VRQQGYMTSREYRAFLKDHGLPCGTTWFHESIEKGLISKPLKIGNRNYWPVSDGPELLATINSQRSTADENSGKASSVA